jgi:Na+/melibiose symporter-like transporter
MVAIQLSIAVSLFGWQAVAKRVGKKITFYIGMLFWVSLRSTPFRVLRLLVCRLR